MFLFPKSHLVPKGILNISVSFSASFLLSFLISVIFRITKFIKKRIREKLYAFFFFGGGGFGGGGREIVGVSLKNSFEEINLTVHRKFEFWELFLRYFLRFGTSLAQRLKLAVLNGSKL